MGQVVFGTAVPAQERAGGQPRRGRRRARGLAGDRSWACLDAHDGTVVSAKHPRRWGRLLGVRASLTADGVILSIAGRAHRAGTTGADAALSAHLGREVRLTRVVPDDARLHRIQPAEAGMVPEWMASAPGDELVTAVAGRGGVGGSSTTARCTW